MTGLIAHTLITVKGDNNSMESFNSSNVMKYITINLQPKKETIKQFA